ncbi:MAG: hypothetical protein KTR32_34470, partial [Granulosicoccus sp.]|nr:hypothetical protein [Granulosicoccus sp.]
MSEPVRSDTAGVNDPPHLKPLDVQTGIVGKPVLLRLDYCDPEGEAPGTIATNTPHGSSLPDNGDGTRTFFWVPEKALETTVVFTVYEESDRRIRTSISVPFIIEPAPQPLFAISPSPEIPPQGTSASAHFQISGQVMRLSGLDYPDQIQYRASNVAEIVYDQGYLQVDRSGRWQGQINLAFGLNQIELELDDLSEPVTINVTYNPGYTFSGLLELQPDVAYVNEPRLIHARIALNDPRTGAADVQLIDKASEVPVAMLTDDGDLSNGDDIESDGVYSALFTIDENEPVNQDFQVQVTLPNGQVARSEDVQVIIRQRLDSEEINNIVLQQSIFEAALATADEQQVETLLLSIVEELAKDPQIADVGIN